MTARHFVALSFLLLGTTGCHYFYSSQTPEGVDVGPILTLQLNDDFDQMENVRRLLPKPREGVVDHGPDTIVSYREASVEERRNRVYRSFTIYREATADAASEKYVYYRDMFTDRSRNRKLFEERTAGPDKYFSSYETPWMDTNHGIPTGRVIRDPDFLVAVLKRNMVIVVSYKGSIKYEADYVQQMNEDIAHVANLLEAALAHPVSGRVDR